MKITAETHPGYKVRDDAGNDVVYVTSIDTDAMVLTRLALDASGKFMRDEFGALLFNRYQLLAFRLEPGNVIRVQIGAATE